MEKIGIQFLLEVLGPKVFLDPPQKTPVCLIFWGEKTWLQGANVMFFLFMIYFLLLNVISFRLFFSAVFSPISFTNFFLSCSILLHFWLFSFIHVSSCFFYVCFSVLLFFPVRSYPHLYLSIYCVYLMFWNLSDLSKWGIFETHVLNWRFSDCVSYFSFFPDCCVSVVYHTVNYDRGLNILYKKT